MTDFISYLLKSLLSISPVPLIVSVPSSSSVQVTFSPQVPLVAADATSGTNAQSMDNARTMLKNFFFICFSS